MTLYNYPYKYCINESNWMILHVPKCMKFVKSVVAWTTPCVR